MRALAPIVLTFLLSAAIATAADSKAPKPPELALEAYTLPNGLKVALHRDPLVPRVTVTVAYHVGSKNEKAGRTGFAHFFEHMMFRGTKNVPNYDIPLQEAGASSNAFTNQDMTVYFETVPSNFLERALYLEAERLAFLPSALDQQKFDTEREVVKNERRQSYENRPYGLDSEAILAALFPKGHPYSWSVIGSMDDLNKATLDDLKEFFAEFYHPANATLCLAGDFDPAEAKALIQKYFGSLAAGPKPKAVAVPPAPAKAEKLVRFDRVQLPRVYWNWPAVAADHPDAPALDLLARVLAGGETSRLHHELVLEKRLSKDVSAQQLRLGVGRPIRAPEHRREGGQARGGARGDRVGVRRRRARDQSQPAHGGRARPRPGALREAVVRAPDQSALPRDHAGHRLRPERRPAPLSEGIRAVLPGHAGRPDPRRRHVPDAREGRRLDRGRQPGTAAERGGESRAEPVGSGCDARDRLRPRARRRVSTGRRCRARRRPGRSGRPSSCGRRSRTGSTSGSRRGRRCPWSRSSCWCPRVRPTTRRASPALRRSRPPCSTRGRPA